MPTYRYKTDWETTTLDNCGSLAEAIEEAEYEIREGTWDDNGTRVSARVEEVDADGNVVDHDYIDVEVPPNHAALIRRATHGVGCGDSPDDHDWTGEGEGGCTENPGVWSVGGTAMVFKAHCTRCGLHRTERTTGAQRNPGEHDTVEYEMPDLDD